ncbi:MAG TPA: class I SAM-dependent methyltransferase [Anaeromyxobacteraceae bacterium]|nr:class I SAM-dependent methyltransferase [Anaeromyxobacteraceae bacterium]
MDLPRGIDVDAWIARWDRMQECFLVARQERFVQLVRLVRAAVGTPRTIVDLGCGTGSVAALLLEAFPEVQVVGLDLDPTLLPLARKRCERYRGRVRFAEVDLRSETWTSALGASPDAAVSATALHWLTAEQLARLYCRLAAALAPGGVFLNADHAASSIPGVQACWKAGKWEALARQGAPGEAWDRFWEEYFAVLGPGARAAREAAVGRFEGEEEGLPLAWQLDALRAAGFAGADCFWRCDGDAIYGASKPTSRAERVAAAASTSAARSQGPCSSAFCGASSNSLGPGSDDAKGDHQRAASGGEKG